MYLRHLFFAFFALLTLGSCITPEEEEFCVVPTTNNPSVTREKQKSLLPTASY